MTLHLNRWNSTEKHHYPPSGYLIATLGLLSPGSIHYYATIMIVFCASILFLGTTSYGIPVGPSLSASPISLFTQSNMIPSLTDATVPEKNVRLYPELFDPIIFPALVPGDPNGLSVLRPGFLRQNLQWTHFQSAAGAPFVPTTSFKDNAAVGATVIPTLQIKGATWTRPASCDPKHNGGQTFGSWAAKDTSATWNPVYGYSKLVYDFMKAFALAHQIEVHTVVIENEVDQSGNTWCDYIENNPLNVQPWSANYQFQSNNNPYASRANYVRTLATAKKAFIDAAAEYNALPATAPITHIRVADSGMMGSSITALALNYLITKPDYIPTDGVLSTTEKNVFELADDLISVSFKDANNNLNWAGAASVIPALMQGTSAFRAKGVIDLTRVIDPNLGERPIDVVNFHNHASAGGVAGMVEYLKQMYPGLPIIANEVGMGSPDKLMQSTVDADFEGPLLIQSVTQNGQPPFQVKPGHLVTAPTAPAVIAPAELVKKNVRMVAAGVEHIFWYGYSTHGGSNISLGSFSNFSNKLYIGLVVPENIRAFINLKKRISSQPIKIISGFLPNDLEFHIFQLSNKNVGAAWVKNVSTAVTHSYPSAAFSMCTVYDVYGNVITPINGQLQVSTEPLFLECP